VRSVDIVIVNWNAGALLANCIESLRDVDEQRYVLGRIVVVDNASSDRSLEPLETGASDKLQLVRSATNLGFGRACNLGARASSADWLLFLNPDTRLSPDSIDVAFACIDMSGPDADVGACGIQLVDDAGHVARTCARFPTPMMFLFAAIGLDRIWPNVFRSHVMNEWDHATTREVDHVIGAFYLVKRAAFAAVGGFDERFFAYLEDLDLSLRLRAQGHRSLFCAASRAYHKGGGTSRAILGRRLFLALRSRLQYSWKHFGVLGATMVSVATLFVEPLVRLLRALFTLQPRDAANVLHAYALLYTAAIPVLLRNRA